MNVEHDQSTPDVGHRIRALREQAGFSLRALADRCGLSINAISRIERGENSPTVASLHQLSMGLGVPITDFFTEENPQVTVILKHDRRPRTNGNGVLLESLGTGLPDQRLEPFMLTLQPGSESTLEPVTHLGEEFILCREGQVEYQVGDQVYWLESGDSLLFQAMQPHKCRNTSTLPAVILMIFEAAAGAPLSWGYHIE